MRGSGVTETFVVRLSKGSDLFPSDNKTAADPVRGSLSSSVADEGQK